MADAGNKSLEARVRELEDVREIQDLFFKWHYDNTGGFNGKQPGRLDFLDCLTDDATIEIQGLHEPGKGPRGRKEYTEFTEYYFGDDGPLPYVFQTSVAEKIEVDGDTAVQTTNQLGIFQFRSGDTPGRGELAKASLSLTQRVNHLVRTKDGWRIQKTLMQGGFSIPIEELHGNLNKLPEKMAQRTPWTYKG